MIVMFILNTCITIYNIFVFLFIIFLKFEYFKSIGLLSIVCGTKLITLFTLSHNEQNKIDA
uniref:Uncharacterized protein n=1 Tax=viral metagenome TaxID=1070528 RepID=A0A6C0LG88_9ZZZZ